jgi:hypothetical protein
MSEKDYSADEVAKLAVQFVGTALSQPNDIGVKIAALFAAGDILTRCLEAKVLEAEITTRLNPQ